MEVRYMAVQGDSIQAEASTLEKLAAILAKEGWTADEVGCMLTIFHVREITVEIQLPDIPFKFVEIPPVRDLPQHGGF